MIITFANLKGGVGKSTLVALYANHLAACIGNDRIRILDTDEQGSILKLRDEDKSGDDTFDSYRIVDCKDWARQEESEIVRVMELIRKDKGVYLVDTPGNIGSGFLVHIFRYSDYIVIPYRYDRLILNATLMFFSMLKRISQKCSAAKMAWYPGYIFLPNLIEHGTTEERTHYDDVDSELKKLGNVLRRVPKRVAISRHINTRPCYGKSSDGWLETFIELDNLINIDKYAK